MTIAATARTIVRRHRASPAELRAELRTLDHRLTASADYFERLTADRQDVYAAYEDMKARAVAAEDEAVRVRAERDDMQAEWNDLAELVEQQHTELVELRARVANLDPYRGLAIGAREVDPDDAPTEPIDVRAFRSQHAVPAADAIAVMPLRFAPFATTGPAVLPPDGGPSMAMRFAAGAHVVTVSGDHRRTH